MPYARCVVAPVLTCEHLATIAESFGSNRYDVDPRDTPVLAEPVGKGNKPLQALRSRFTRHSFHWPAKSAHVREFRP